MDLKKTFYVDFDDTLTKTADILRQEILEGVNISKESGFLTDGLSSLFTMFGTSFEARYHEISTEPSIDNTDYNYCAWLAFALRRAQEGTKANRFFSLKILTASPPEAMVDKISKLLKYAGGPKSKRRDDKDILERFLCNLDNIVYVDKPQDKVDYLLNPETLCLLDDNVELIKFIENRASVSTEGFTGDFADIYKKLILKLNKHSENLFRELKDTAKVLNPIQLNVNFVSVNSTTSCFRINPIGNPTCPTSLTY